VESPSSAGRAVSIHPPKVDLLDVEAMTTTDHNGRVRPVDRYIVEPFGIYLARPVTDHPRMTYVQSWLLPEVGLQVSNWSFRPEPGRRPYVYLDVVDVERDRRIWRCTDNYLDIVVYPGERLDVLDTDELLAALDAGLIDAATAERALRVLYLAVEGLGRHHYALDAWLATLGVSLTWCPGEPAGPA
jgi:predicted RNA-binding protein associated with RNAse of E/G family